MTISESESVLTISTVASRLGVSTHAVRLYEREGLLRPKKTPKGHRIYSGTDVDLLMATRRLLGKGLNFAGIRRLYATLPCHLYKPCCIPRLGHCTIQDRPGEPCWSIADSWCRLTHQDCQSCKVYHLAAQIDRVREKWGQSQIQPRPAVFASREGNGAPAEVEGS